MRFALLLLLLTITVRADQIATPNPLSNDTVADADAVQANFDTLIAESNENDTRIGTLEANVRRDDTDFNLVVGSGLQNLTPDSQNDLAASYNTAVGLGALDGNTTGYQNTAAGINALFTNITGGFNSEFGNGALYSNEVGIENTATGSRAAYTNTTGSQNTAVGREALHDNAEGGSNTASGYQALYSNTTGYANTASGQQALSSNTTGNWNTAIGSYADVVAGTLQNATAIGYNAKVNANDKIQLGNDQVNSVATAGKLTSGAVTYPNEDGELGQVLTTDGGGNLSWAADSDELSTLCNDEGFGHIPVWTGNFWKCSTQDGYAARAAALEEQLASLQEQLQSQQEELLAIVQSQQEQIAQLQRMTGEQFASK